MQSDTDALTYIVERLPASELLSKWTEITNALVAGGHVADLYHELDSQTGYGNPVRAHASQPAYQHHDEPYHGPLLDKSKQSANGVAPDRSTDNLANIDEDVSASDLDESESENDIYDEMIVPSHLVDEGADLSEYHHTDSPLTFEKLFAQERSLGRGAGASDELEAPSNHLDGDSMMTRIMAPSLLTLPPPEVEQYPGRHSGPDGVPEKDLVLEAERRDSIVEKTKLISPPRTSLPRRGKTSQKAHGLRVSDKKNLTSTEIPVVADRLISQDAISYFLCHCHSFYEYWMPCFAQQPLGCSNDIETSVVAAFDRVHDLLKNRRTSGLLLRFAYIQLTRVIDDYKAVEATDRTQG